MRVALLTPAFWPEVMRGTERFVHDLGRGLQARGHQPRVITSHRARGSEGVEGGLPVTRVWRPPRGSLERRLYERYLTHLPLSYLALRRGDDGVAHAMFQTDAVVAARWGRQTGRPAVFSLRAMPDHRTITGRRLRLRFMAEAVSGCDAVCSPSQAVADALRRWLGVNSRVIRPGVDLDAFRPVAPRAGEPTIFSAATPDEPRKRLALVVQAFESVRRARPGARLRLVRPADPAMARELLDAGPGIELLSPVESPDELARAYSGAWLTVSSALGDGFPGSLLESLACGTPVVGPAADAVPELVDRDSVGRLFEGEAVELARTLLEGLELGEDGDTPTACRARAEELSSERCTDSYVALYAELLEKAGG